MLSSQSPPQISIWNQWLFTRQNWCEQGFCTFLLRSKAPWCASTSPWTGEAWAPCEDNIRSVKPFAWLKHPKVDPTPLSVSRALKFMMWPSHMEPPAGCFPVLLLRDLSVLFSYLVNLSDGFFFFFFFSPSPREAAVRCSWKRTLGNMSARS